MKIESIRCRRILNSHGDFTGEFVLSLADGRVGVGSAPQGETISIYEDVKSPIDPGKIVALIADDGMIGAELTQKGFDGYLGKNFKRFGRNNAFALSLALFDARSRGESIFDLFERPAAKLEPPALCLNILNGGRHAYTNPVLSDFSEIMLVARTNDVERVVGDHAEIQRKVREGLLKLDRTVVNGNPVHRFKTLDNREPIEFLAKIRDGLGLGGAYDIMIDASAGDLRDGDGYRLALTDDKMRSSGEFLEYWEDLVRECGIVFLEDPFHEKDFESWTALTTAKDACHVIGDNLYSSDASRIEDGARRRLSHAAVVKPNQSGTVTAVVDALRAAGRHGITAITSHRSISTESTFLSTLTCVFDVKYIKIGPLFTDYSSIVRLNEILRLAAK